MAHSSEVDTLSFQWFIFAISNKQPGHNGAFGMACNGPARICKTEPHLQMDYNHNELLHATFYM